MQRAGYVAGGCLGRGRIGLWEQELLFAGKKKSMKRRLQAPREMRPTATLTDMRLRRIGDEMITADSDRGQHQARPGVAEHSLIWLVRQVGP
jgi:hypothetical protein